MPDHNDIPTERHDDKTVSRLTTIVALAVLCRDNGIDWPRDVEFSDDYPDGLWIKTSSLPNFEALVEAMGARRPEISATDQNTHYNARANWSGFKVYLLHLAPLPVVTPPVDAETSAAIDDLAATVNAEPTSETEAQIGAALAVPIELVDEPNPAEPDQPTNPNWPVDLRTAREATPREIRWANKQCTTCGYFPPCQCPGNPFGTGLGEAVTRS